MQISYPLDGVLYANFTSNQKLLTIGTTYNFKIFKLNQDPIDLLYQSGNYFNNFHSVYLTFSYPFFFILLDPSEKSNFEIVESIDKLVFTVSSDENNKLKIWNYKDGKVIDELSFSSQILSLRANSKYTVLCFTEEIHIFYTDPFQFVTKISISYNPLGVIALTHNEPHLLAYPSRNDRGEFIVYNIESHEKMNLIYDHSTPISKLQFNYSCDKIASVSVTVCKK